MNHPVHGICIVLVYVDDILIISDSIDRVTSQNIMAPGA